MHFSYSETLVLRYSKYIALFLQYSGSKSQLAVTWTSRRSCLYALAFEVCLIFWIRKSASLILLFMFWILPWQWQFLRNVCFWYLNSSARSRTSLVFFWKFHINVCSAISFSMRSVVRWWWTMYLGLIFNILLNGSLLSIVFNSDHTSNAQNCFVCIFKNWNPWSVKFMHSFALRITIS